MAAGTDEHPNSVPALDEQRYQVVSQKAGGAGDEYHNGKIILLFLNFALFYLTIVLHTVNGFLERIGRKTAAQRRLIRSTFAPARKCRRPLLESVLGPWSSFRPAR